MIEKQLQNTKAKSKNKQQDNNKNRKIDFRFI